MPYIRGLRFSPEEFDMRVLLIVRSNKDTDWTARGIARKFNLLHKESPCDVNRVLRSMKRLSERGSVRIKHVRRGWFNYYTVRYTNG